ncbi:MAG: HPP family protein [Rhodothermales bacterium]
MTIKAIINQDIRPLSPSETVENALSLLLEHGVYHLPVVDEQGRVLGSLSEDQLLSSAGPDCEVASLLVYDPARRPVSVSPESHVFDVTKKLVEHHLTVVPAVSADGTYVGLVRRHDLFEQFARMLSTQERGAILALELNPMDYSLAQLVYTIENSDVKVLSIASEPPDPITELIRVTIKLNTTDASRVRHMLEHHGYHVVASFSEEESDEDLQWRVEEFMRYLEV